MSLPIQKCVKMSNDNSSKVLKGLSVQTLVTIVLAVLEIVYFSIMSRLLSRSDFGYFAAATGIMTILSSLSEAGLGAAIIQKSGNNGKHLSTAFTLSLLFGVVISVMAFIAASGIANTIADDTLTTPLRLMSITVLLHCLNSCGNAMLHKKLRFKRAGINVIISQFFSYSIAIIMAIKGMGLYAIVTNAVLQPFLTFVMLYSYSVKFPKLGIHHSEVKNIISFGGWLTLSTLVNNVVQQVDKLLLPRWMSLQALGSYNRPAGFINTIGSKINSIFDTVLFPMLSSIQEEREKIHRVFSRGVELLNTFSVVLSACFVLNSNLIIRFFFGENWLDLSIILQILSLNLIFTVDNRLVDCFFRSLNLVRYGFILRCLGLFLTLLFIFLGSRMGLVGVAAGAVLANVFIIILKMIVLCHSIQYQIKRMAIIWISSWKSSIPFIFLGIGLMLFNDNVLCEVIVAILSFAILAVEMIFCPKVLGKEYTNTIYPRINSILNKIWQARKF